GMGFEHVKVARIANGLQPLRYEQFPCQTKVSTCSLDGSDNEGQCIAASGHITDSAAAATAIATGIKVKNNALSKHPEQEGELETILEMFKKAGKSTGVVATKLFTDATPAAFISHVDHRSMTEQI